MKTLKMFSIAAALALSTAAGAAEKAADKAPAKAAEDEPVTILLLVPVDVSKQSLGNGCWAQLYDKRDFKGDVFTMVGPIQLDTADKAAGRTLHRNLDSLVVGPKATLTVYEHKLFKDKSVKFAPNSKEGGLIKRLGFTGRVESLKLECGS